ncbi:MAG: glycine--tRNA ligase subunit beta, partial [Betaproteobacteria bacterium]|nr:glycine--tRNA ligase subunit beta [Betaproteobacteria bacterium]
TMKLNQKYFPLFLSEGGLSSRFLVVSNMRVNEPQRIIEGNERVVRPRLADAKFFFEQDKKKTLESRLPGLDKVVYHARLGSQGDRSRRVAQIADQLAATIDSARWQLVRRAAQLAKADLLTDMVGEFPELQGVMGRYYALHDGEPRDVADAIWQHYQPRFAGDVLPGNTIAVTLALADKLETLAGLFGIGQRPSGDKDPFGLRRHALGVLRILMEKKLVLPLDELLRITFTAFPDAENAASTELTDFIFDRLRGILRDQGYTANDVESVVSLQPMRIDLVPVRLAAVKAFMQLPEAESLAAANKRIGNILKKSDEVFRDATPGRMIERAEQVLFGALLALKKSSDEHYAAGDFTEALKVLAPLKEPVDAFFNDVMVNVEDADLRRNRLALLGDLHALMNRVADLSKLAA